MREIKFRAWDGQKLVNVETLAYEASAGSMIANGWILPKFIMSFTGLHDKNGKEIYEGDILKHRQGVDAVNWDQDQWRVGSWCPDGLAGFCSETYDEDDEFPEVIGNIYDNPEVVK